LLRNVDVREMNYAIRRMIRSDIEAIAETFAGWNKTREQYERYFAENQRGERITLVAVVGERVAGYTNIVWESNYEPFRQDSIPEITDLNVIGEFQNQGLGRALIQEAERIAAEAGKSVMGIGVGLTPDYAAAQHLYPKLGYVADGRGVRHARYGDETFLTKRLSARKTD